MSTEKLRIIGPLWSAEADVIELADPKKTLALRSLFVDRSPRAHDKLWLPGTVLALVSVKTVKIKPWENRPLTLTWNCPAKWNASFTLGKDQDLRPLLDRGRLALLLLRIDPAEPGGPSTASCLAGEINLDAMKRAAAKTVARLYGGLGLKAPSPDNERVALTVHGSGLSIYGKANLPWEAPDNLLPAPFFLQRDPEWPGALKLTLETECMAVEERDVWLASWQKLASFLTPNNPVLPGTRSGDPPRIPQWATLEVANPLAIPRLFWRIQKWRDPQLRFEPAEFELLLTDRQPYGLQPPTSLARLTPQIEVVRESGNLFLSFDEPADEKSLLYEYKWERGSDAESFRADLLRLAFDPVETPRFLRQRQELPEPEWSCDSGKGAPVDPAVLWGFMPLADGWAQLPVPNLTEQIYLDAQLANLAALSERAAGTASLLQGAVTLDNDDHSTLRPPANEQPFSVTLTGVQGFSGTWQLQGEAASGYHIETVQLNLYEPELVIDGLLWFSRGRPTVGDALPNLDDWLTGLQTITLRTISTNRLFPAPVAIDLAPFGIERRHGSAEAQGQARSDPAKLQAWSWQYRAEQDALADLIGAGALPQDPLRRSAPLIWRRHPHLPMVQALPLTQNQVPANEPSASRQLLPFILPVAERDNLPPIPHGWKFGVKGGNGAASWPLCQHENLVPAIEWQALGDLPLVSLSLPGLVLHPEAKMASLDETLGLGWQYRFDLPFLDEVNALAQLPKVEENPAERTILLAPATPPPPQPPLAREDYEAHWRRLDELARLAAADAVEALRQQDDGQTMVQHLVEPYEWPVTPELELGEYPGSLTLSQGGKSLVLSLDQALEGISGNFAETNNKLALVDGSQDADSKPYTVTTGSMAAHAALRRNVSGRKSVHLRDQRGLSRSASGLLDDVRFLITPVQFREKSVKLVSALEPVNLHVGGPTGAAGEPWQFWFRDLPVDGDLFDRDKIVSREAQDINDPATLVPCYNYLRGYEWRLGSEECPGGPLLLYNLHFYPLRLQKLRFDGGTSEVEIAGRLQLPTDRVSNAVDLADLSNVVVLTFKADVDGNLQFSQITMDTASSTSGEWPLAVSGSELTDAPSLRWTGIAKGDDNLQIQGASLQFLLFGARWSVSLRPLVIPRRRTQVSCKYRQDGTSSSEHQLAVERMVLTLDLSEVPQHKIDVFLGVNLGRRTKDGTAFRASMRCTWGKDENWSFHCEQASLFDDLKIGKSLERLVYHNNTFQFSWSACSGIDVAGLRFLPGMHLNEQMKEAPGFAALSFRAEPTEAVPVLVLESAFLEALLFFRWGASLQASAREAKMSPEQVFGSSAGDLAVGYTASWQPAPTKKGSGRWLEDFILNGWVEAKNLISWPEGLIAPGGQNTEWRLPAISDQAVPLNHLRHTIRILFNQHHLPVELLRMGAGKLLFDLLDDVVWQFPAIVEHQLARVKLEEGVSSPCVSRDHRWTALQEVRVFTPGGFAAALPQGRDPDDSGVKAKYTDLSWDPPPEDDSKSARIELHLQSQQSKFDDIWTVVQEWKEGSDGWQWRDLESGKWHGSWNISGQYVVAWTVKPQDTSNHEPPNKMWYRWTIYGSKSEKRPDAVPLAITGRFQMPPSRKRRTIQVDIAAYQQALKVLDNAWGGYYSAELHDLLARGPKPALKGLGSGSLIVEASAPHWINQRHVSTSKATVVQLQYLPTGSQSAVLGSPDDFAPSDPHEPKWLLLTMPFLGRLQDASCDGIDGTLLASGQEDHGPLRIDPLLYLHRQYRCPSPPADASGRTLARILAHWGKDTPIQIRLSEFDTTVGRSFARLDTLSLQENWLRIHKPPPEALATTLASVMATLPDTPARLSRSAALKQAFDSFPCDPAPPRLVWQPDSLLIYPLVAGISSPDAALSGWPLTGIHLQASNLTQKTDASPVYHAAATLIPVKPDGNKGHYVSLAVSPYLGIGFKPGPKPSDTELTLWSSELLCLDRAARQLRPVANRFWEPQVFPIAIVTNPGTELPSLSIAQVRDIFAGEITNFSEVGGPDAPITVVSREEGSRTRAAFGELVMAHEEEKVITENAQLQQSDGQVRTTVATTPNTIGYISFDFLGDSIRPVEIDGVAPTVDNVKNDSYPIARPLNLLPNVVDEVLERWAQQIHQRLSPDSPIAVLRVREIRKRAEVKLPNQPSDQEVLITTYRHRIVMLEEDPVARLGQRLFPLRTKIAQLHFAEGQFGGFELPAKPRPFELAPPQTTGVQPVYVPKNGKDGGEWQWGLSALRLSLAYTDGAAGIAGPAAAESGKNLWWLALQHRVQYRSGEAGLPTLFRAPAIKSLLPVLPQPRLPDLDPTVQPEDNGAKSLLWQPLLPGALRYWLVGARPGAMLVLRHQLLRQSLAKDPPALMVSGSIPVQHRVPRPVPLPPNDPSYPQYALRTWAGHFDAQSTVLASANPVDEAFFAAYVVDLSTAPAGQAQQRPDQPVVDAELRVIPANRTRLILERPVRGEIKPDWDAKFTLGVEREPASYTLNYDAIQALVVVGGTSYACKREKSSDDGHLTFRVADDLQGLRIQLASLLVGSSLSLLLRVPALDDPDEPGNNKPGQDQGNQVFKQALRFPLRVTNERVVPLPVEPRFLHFEDPEYNRRLASTAVQTSGVITLRGTSHLITFSVDRRDYNPDSSIAWRFDPSLPEGAKATLSVQRIRAEDARPVTLTLAKKIEGLEKGDSGEYTLEGGSLCQCSLLDFGDAAGQAQASKVKLARSLKPDDVLMLQLSIAGGSETLNLRLTVNIVEEPIIPVPEAAYALLRWQQMDGKDQVECVRFAWSPQPSRVEMVCAQDLRTGIVRRRAVFQWRDSVRPGTPSGYAVQKITQTGSTHIPDSCAIVRDRCRCHSTTA